MSDENKNNAVGAILTLIVIGAGGWYYFGGGLEKQAVKSMRQIEQQVAEDAVDHYEIAKRSGNQTDAYVQAGIVAASYLQANDEYNYKKWKRIQASEAARADLTTR